MNALPGLTPPVIFPSFSADTPDLGCLVLNKHPFGDKWTFPLYLVEGLNVPHQTYFRVKCGDAAFFQRCRIYMLPGVLTINDAWPLVNFEPPDWVLGGDYLPYPSDWLKYPPRYRDLSVGYWFVGENRDPSQPNWEYDDANGHSYDIYENGFLTTLQWEDVGGVNGDFNDLIMEIAVVRRRPFVFERAPAQRVKELGQRLEEGFDRLLAHSVADAAEAERTSD
jgi:hypothetical protein